MRNSLLLPLLFCGLLATGCATRKESGVPLAGAIGGSRGGSPLLILPQGDWKARDDRLVPARRHSIPLLVVDHRARRDDLVVTVHGLALDDGPVRVRWNGQLVEEARPVAPDAVRVDLPASRLSGGLDLVELSFPASSGESTSLTGVHWASGDEQGSFDVDDLSHLRNISHFIEYGVAGEEPLLEGGLLAHGDTVVRLDALPPGAERLRLGVRNLGGGRGEFSVRALRRGRTVEARREFLDAGESVELGLRVSGADAVELTRLEAHADALTLWIQPRVVEPTPRVPLIVLMTLDTTRRDALGAYDEAATWTPRLDELATTASVYERAVSTTSWTLPAHASIFTGLAPREHTAGVTAAALPPHAVTLAQRLSTRYRTVGIAGGPLVRHTFGVGRGFGSYRVAESNELTGAEVTDFALGILEESEGEPLFLFLNYFDPHFPYRIDHPGPVSRAARAAAGALPKGSLGRRLTAGGVHAWLDLIEQRRRPTTVEIDALKRAYAAEVAEMDRQIGRLLDRVRRDGRFEEALIVAVADHGELLGERGQYSHAARLEPELTSVPLIVKYPGQRAPERVPELVSIADLYATVLVAASLDPGDGESIALRHDLRLARREAVLFEEHESIVHPLSPAIRLGSNLIGLESRGERRTRWSGGEDCWIPRQGTWTRIECATLGDTGLARRLAGIPLQPRETATAGARDIDPVERARLRALGYL